MGIRSIRVRQSHRACVTNTKLPSRHPCFSPVIPGTRTENGARAFLHLRPKRMVHRHSGLAGEPLCPEQFQQVQVRDS